MVAKTLRNVLVIMIICAVPVMGGWIKNYGGDGDDAGRCVRQTHDGGFIVIGNKTVQDDDIDVWLLRTDIYGDTFWTKTFGNEEMNIGYCVNPTSDSGYILGTSHWLIRLDAEGNELWEKDYGSYYVEETSDGGFILAATREGMVLLVKTDEHGNSVWTKTVESERVSYPHSIRQTSDGGYIVAAYQHEVAFAEWVLKDYAWFFKTDAEGTIEWQYPIEGDEGTRGYCAAETPDGGYILSGKQGWDAATATYLILVKTDLAGDVQWEYNAAENPQQDVSGNWVTPSSDGGFALANSKWTIFKVDADGGIDWTQDYQRSAAFIDQTSDGGFVLTGESDGDLFVIKTNHQGDTVSVNENHSRSITWRTSEIGREIILSYEDYPQGFSVQVFDITGRRVDMISSEASSGAVSWGADREPGVYFITEATYPGLTRRVILVK